MLSKLREKLRLLSDYNKLAHIEKIARRYFVMNSFDGVLAILGILVGSLIAGAPAALVVSTGIAAGIAMGVSGIWGAYLTERAERQKEIRDLERATLTKLKATQIERAAKAAVVIIALVDGIAPLAAALIVLMPFLILRPFLALQQIYYLSIGIAFAALFMLGVFLGNLSRENIIKMGLIMILAGLASVGLSYILLGTVVA
ncbi:hypothetical protein HYY74_06580 [Candidatus Woesearchaeota archaeon]|nr:hypothetical protein [Candidatus Woesearchaeota archaeon]